MRFGSASAWQTCSCTRFASTLMVSSNAPPVIGPEISRPASDRASHLFVSADADMPHVRMHRHAHGGGGAMQVHVRSAVGASPGPGRTSSRLARAPAGRTLSGQVPARSRGARLTPPLRSPERRRVRFAQSAGTWRHITERRDRATRRLRPGRRQARPHGL